MTLPNIGNEEFAADFLRVTVDQLAEWRQEGKGPNHTSLRGGGARYTTRDMKIYLRGQMAKSKSGK